MDEILVLGGLTLLIIGWGVWCNQYSVKNIMITKSCVVIIMLTVCVKFDIPHPMNFRLSGFILFAAVVGASFSASSAGLKMTVAEDPSHSVFGYAWGRTETLTDARTDRQLSIYEQFRFVRHPKELRLSLLMKHQGVLGQLKRMSTSRLSSYWSKDPSGTWVMKLGRLPIHYLSSKYFRSNGFSWVPKFASAQEERELTESESVELRWNERNPNEMLLVQLNSAGAILKTVNLKKLICSASYCRESPKLSENERASLN